MQPQPNPTVIPPPTPSSSVYSRQQYAQADFWQSRYSTNKKVTFDWYAQYPELKNTFESMFCLDRTSQILMLGCGNSKLSQQMYDDGYHNIVNIDISESVIRQMKEDLDAKGKKMQWLVMDGTQMGFESRRFDVVVDKGTLDAVICGRDLTISDRMLEEVSRVVKPTGKIIVITHSPPEGRKKVFQKSLPFELFDYTFTKLPLSDVAMLINLMRSNLKDKPLKSILSEKEALQRSMLEYRLIQFRKKQKKPVKYYVSWGEYEGKEEVGGGGAGGGKEEEERGGGKVQEAGKQGNKKSVEEKIEVKNQSEEKKEDSKEPPSANPNPTEPNPTTSTQPTTTYNPQKQTHCFVYCIEYKPHLTLSHLLSQYTHLQSHPVDSLLQQLQITDFIHQPSVHTLEINPEIEQCLIVSTTSPFPFLTVLKHLQTIKRPMPRIIVNYSGSFEVNTIQEDPNNQKSVVARWWYEVTEGKEFEVQVVQGVKARLGFTWEVGSGVVEDGVKGFGRDVMDQIRMLQQSVDMIKSQQNMGNLSPDLYSRLLKTTQPNLLSKFLTPDLILQSITPTPTKTTVINGFITVPPTTNLPILSTYLSSQHNLIITHLQQGFVTEPPGYLTECLTDFNKSYTNTATPICTLDLYGEKLSKSNSWQILHLSKEHAPALLSKLLLACFANISVK